MIMPNAPANTAGLVTIVNTSQGNNLNYTWNFGNGFISNNATPFTTITNSGTYAICLTISDSTGACNDTFCDTITVDSAGNFTRAVLPGNLGIVVVGAPQPSAVTSIQNVDQNLTLDVAPNPSQGIFTLNTASLSGLTNIEVMDLSGKQVFVRSFNTGKGSNKMMLDLQSLANGNYVIKAVSENTVKTARVIINH
jgi:PKD repeat protein